LPSSPLRRVPARPGDRLPLLGQVMMALAEQDPATGWINRVVMDRDGEQLGPCTGVLGDDGTGLPQWLSVEVGLGTTWVPAPGAAVLPEQVVVAVSRAEIVNAPLIMQDQPSEEEEAALYGYYGTVPPVDPSARRRWLLLAAGVLGGLAALAGAVLARRHLVRGGADVFLRSTRAVVSAVPVAAAPAAEVGGQVAARAAGLAAVAGRKGAETGVTVARVGASAARSAGARAAQVAGTAAGAAVSLAAAAGSSEARAAASVSAKASGRYQRWFQRVTSNCRSEGGK